MTYDRDTRQPLIDPTANVLSLVEAAVKRLDDLRIADSKRVDDMMELRTTYRDRLELAEAKRIDAIRAVDVAAVTVASERATQQATVLASQVVASAETLRAALAQMATQLTDRLALLENTSMRAQDARGCLLPSWLYLAQPGEWYLGF